MTALQEPAVNAETARSIGLNAEEFERLRQILGRDPNWTELGVTSALWSEHCSYKHSRPVLKRFPTTGSRVLQGPGENAGVLSLGHGWAVAFKIESHNHPSAVEPYQGAATGVGGILRDVFTMGARPIAVLNSLRFGPLSDPRNRYLFAGVVRGVGDYGNCVGVPTIGGEVDFEPNEERPALSPSHSIGAQPVVRANERDRGLFFYRAHCARHVTVVRKICRPHSRSRLTSNVRQKKLIHEKKRKVSEMRKRRHHRRREGE